MDLFRVIMVDLPKDAGMISPKDFCLFGEALYICLFYSPRNAVIRDTGYGV